MTSPTSIARSLFGEERLLAGLGLLGLALAVACGAAALVRGTALVPPGGDLTKPMSFDGAIGIWVLTIAALLPYADFGPRGRRVWRGAFLLAMLYFYFGETYAAVRGHDPRFFSGDFGPVDPVVAALFGLDAIVVITLFVVFATRFFTRRAIEGAPGIVLGVRWAVAATLVAFGIGVWMIVLEGRQVGAEGSAVWPHALGFHALQAVVVVGWLAGRGVEEARGIVHVAGAAWLIATLAALAQTAGGRAPAQPSIALAAQVLAIGTWAVAVLAVWRRARPEPAPATP